MKNITDFSMESDNLVAFLFKFKGYASFKTKGIGCLLISLEPKHGNDRRVTSKYFIAGAIHSRDVFTWIINVELQ